GQCFHFGYDGDWNFEASIRNGVFTFLDNDATGGAPAMLSVPMYSYPRYEELPVQLAQFE
ncbi:MAG TPA: hypothetical protein VFU15_15300, partial [Bacteroidia bacterium]|nr:hypothetical protein [Bacteroidia bacterium]